MYDVIIIGAGPAGLTAALYCGRSKLRTKIIDKSQAGGQINITDEIENYPGLFKVSAKDLVSAMVKQVNSLADVEMQDFSETDFIKYNENAVNIKGHSTIDDSSFEYETKALIIATGAYPKKLGVKGEDAFQGKGVSYCAVCDGPLFRDKEVVLIGGGDTALEEALYLAKYAKKVKIIHRRGLFRASGLLEERAKNNPKIEFILNSVAVEILGKNLVEKIIIKNVKTNKENEISCNGIFIFVGYQPNTQFVENLLDLDENKYIIADELMATKKKGIFACGDCRRRPFKQIVTACGEGAVAAHSVEQYLFKNKYYIK